MRAHIKTYCSCAEKISVSVIFFSLLMLPLIGLSLSSVFHEHRHKIFHCFSLTHTTVWSPSLLCHFGFFSHLFHSLITASDDRRMRWGEEECGEWVKDKGLSTVQPESFNQAVIVNIYFEQSELHVSANCRLLVGCRLKTTIRVCEAKLAALSGCAYSITLLS